MSEAEESKPKRRREVRVDIRLIVLFLAFVALMWMLTAPDRIDPDACVEVADQHIEMAARIVSFLTNPDQTGYEILDANSEFYNSDVWRKEWRRVAHSQARYLAHVCLGRSPSSQEWTKYNERKKSEIESSEGASTSER